MTKEVYNKIVAPVAPFEEIKKTKTIVEYVEEVSGHELSKWQKEYITAAYEYYKASHHMKSLRMNESWARENYASIMPFLAVVCAAYEENELY